MAGFYVVHIVGDNRDSLDWYEVHSKRKDAMESAKEYAQVEPHNYPKGVRLNNGSFQGCDNQGYVEVSKNEFLYFGA